MKLALEIIGVFLAVVGVVFVGGIIGLLIHISRHGVNE